MVSWSSWSPRANERYHEPRLRLTRSCRVGAQRIRSCQLWLHAKRAFAGLALFRAEVVPWLTSEESVYSRSEAACAYLLGT